MVKWYQLSPKQLFLDRVESDGLGIMLSKGMLSLVNTFEPTSPQTPRDIWEAAGGPANMIFISSDGAGWWFGEKSYSPSLLTNDIVALFYGFSKSDARVKSQEYLNINKNLDDRMMSCIAKGKLPYASVVDSIIMAADLLCEIGSPDKGILPTPQIPMHILTPSLF